jgi:hypothetical protein
LAAIKHYELSQPINFIFMEPSTTTVEAEFEQALETALAPIEPDTMADVSSNDGPTYGMAFYLKNGYKVTFPLSKNLAEIPSEAEVIRSLKTDDRLDIRGIRASILSSEVVMHFVVVMADEAPISIVREDTFSPVRPIAAPAPETEEDL